MTASTALVAAVIVTHDRREILRSTVHSLLAQSRPPDRIVVVDSGSPDGADDGVLELSPMIDLVAVADNIGVAGGLAVGIRRAAETIDAAWSWLLDDDSPVGPESLERSLAAAAGIDDLGILGNRGGWFRRGRIAHRSGPPPAAPMAVDFCLLDGALVASEAVRRCGVPREDFFMMHQDLEYPVRLGRAGFRVMISDAVSSTPAYLGSTPTAAPRSYWRSYYQSRNHLRWVLDDRSAVGVWGWFTREVKIAVAGFGRGGGGVRKVVLITRGAVDAVRGRMGRTIEPGSR